MSTDLACPVCGVELDLAVLFASAHDHQALARLIAVSVPVGAKVLQYLTLHTPAKQRLTAAKKIKLLMQLLPDLERQAVTSKGRDWPAPLAMWATAIDQMLLANAAGRLDLPLKGHGYLYAVVCGLADKAEGQAEAQALADKRSARPGATVQVHGQTLPISEALQVAYRGKDPALAKLDADASRAAPMPDAVRQRLADFRKGAA